MHTADGRVLRFDKTKLPADDETLAAHIRHALGLGLPELRDFEYPRSEELRVVANGPSAIRAPLDGVTVAVNGALRLFTVQRLAPTYWIACDPQELVADFLNEAPEETIYLVASKCHPAVFERLKDRKVVLWHVGELGTLPLVEAYAPVTPFKSVTACLPEVFARMGYRNFAIWGWDCCVLGGVENAVPQDNAIEQWLTVKNKDREFVTTGTWMLEADDAMSMLKGFPFPVTFHGDGMLGAHARAYLPMKIRGG